MSLWKTICRGVGLAYPDQVQTKGKRTTTWMRTSSYKWIYNHRVIGVISKIMGACTGRCCHGYNLQPWMITPTAPPTMHHQLGQLDPTSECESRATYQATPATSGPTKFEHPTGFQGGGLNHVQRIHDKYDQHYQSQSWFKDMFHLT